MIFYGCVWGFAHLTFLLIKQPETVASIDQVPSNLRRSESDHINNGFQGYIDEIKSPYLRWSRCQSFVPHGRDLKLEPVALSWPGWEMTPDVRQGLCRVCTPCVCSESNNPHCLQLPCFILAFTNVGASKNNGIPQMDGL